MLRNGNSSETIRLITHENPAAGAMHVATLTRERATALER
jgi:hypothetical protein